MNEQWMTISQCQDEFNVSRGYIYKLAARYGWAKKKQGLLRLYAIEDVLATPPADARYKTGVNTRLKPRLCSWCRDDLGIEKVASGLFIGLMGNHVLYRTWLCQKHGQAEFEMRVIREV